LPPSPRKEDGKKDDLSAADKSNRSAPVEKANIDAASKSTQTVRAKDNGVGTVTQRYLDRLARDRPDLLSKVNAGELRPKTAAREAGIIKPPTPLELVQRACKALTDMERQRARKGNQPGATVENLPHLPDEAAPGGGVSINP
jgi:hypothetical protein